MNLFKKIYINAPNSGLHLSVIPHRPIAYEGEARACSSLLGRAAANAFLPEVTSTIPWTNDKDHPFPHHVWFQFQRPKTVTKIGFSTRINADYFGQAPRKFDVIAGNSAEDCSGDATSKAHVLLRIEEAGFQRANQAKSWLIPVEMRKPHLCIGISIHSSAGNGKFVSLQNMIMWESRV